MFIYFIAILSFLYVSALIAFLWYLTKCVEQRRRNAGRQMEFETRFRALAVDQQKSCRPSRSRNSKRSCDEAGDAWTIDHSAPEYKRAKIEEFEDTSKRSRSQSPHHRFTFTMNKPSLSFPGVFQQENVLITPNNENEGAGGDDQVEVDGEKENGQIQPKLENGNQKDIGQLTDSNTNTDSNTVAQRSCDGQTGASGDCLEIIPS